jgi:hypothetical protein
MPTRHFVPLSTGSVMDLTPPLAFMLAFPFSAGIQDRTQWARYPAKLGPAPRLPKYLNAAKTVLANLRVNADAAQRSRVGRACARNGCVAPRCNSLFVRRATGASEQRGGPEQ